MSAAKHMPTPTCYAVVIEYSGQRMPCGIVRQNVNGWRFIPHFQASPSRKGWPTPEAALKGRVKNYTLEAK